MRSYAGLTMRLMLLGVLGWGLLAPPPAAQAQRRRRANGTNSPRAAAPGYRFDSGQSALKIPFELLNNMVALQARVNDSRPQLFILDAGASGSVVDARLAKELGLKVKGRVKGSSGTGDIEAGLIPGVSIALPGVRVFNLTVGSLPLDPMAPYFGRRVGGVLGYDIISRFTVEIDYEGMTVNLYAPAAYSYSGAGERLPIRLVDNSPIIEASVTAEGRAPVKGRFAVATASSGALLLHRPFVQAHQLLKAVSKTSLGNSGGVGGLTRTLVGRLKELRVGRYEIANPLVSFSQAAKGEQASTAYDGTIGGEVLRRFRLVLDYARRQIILEPNAHLPEPLEEDMSGFEFIAEGEDFSTYVVNEIIPDSPASEAGLREEDVLTEIDGRPAAELGLERIRQMFKQEGAEHLLTVKRGEQRLQFRLRLRRLR